MPETTNDGFEARSARTSTTEDVLATARTSTTEDVLATARTSTTEDVLATAPAEEYAGAASVSLDGDDATLAITVEVDLRGRFEPLDGKFHWYGRIATNPALAERVRPGSTVTLTTPGGSAEARLSDVDPWGRFRVSGTGRPPF